MRSNVLVDTSVWIQYFNRLDSKPGKSVEVLLREGRVVGELETTQNTWIKAGRISYTLRGSGITVPTTDLIIASLALEYDCLIFTLDPHFEKVPDV